MLERRQTKCGMRPYFLLKMLKKRRTAILNGRKDKMIRDNEEDFANNIRQIGCDKHEHAGCIPTPFLMIFKRRKEVTFCVK